MTDAPKSKLEGWIPFRFYWRDDEPMLDWCYLGNQPFTDPFFSQTIERTFRHPSNLLFRQQTPATHLERLSSESPGVPVSGFIFHVSRCGSTLVSQMLASVPTNIVISEAPVVDSVITRRNSNSRASDADRIRRLRGLLSALGQPRTGGERRMFVKFDAWNVIDLPLIRSSYPDTPFVFLYRDPVEVLVSQMNQRGAHLVPGVIDPAIFGLDIDTATALPPEEYCAVVLATLYKAGLTYCSHEGVLVNYTQLPEIVFGLASKFGLECSEEDALAMSKTARLDAKNPYQQFEDDRERKRSKASLEIIKAAEEYIYPVYEKLEVARLAQPQLSQSIP